MLCISVFNRMGASRVERIWDLLREPHDETRPVRTPVRPTVHVVCAGRLRRPPPVDASAAHGIPRSAQRAGAGQSIPVRRDPLLAAVLLESGPRTRPQAALGAVSPARTRLLRQRPQEALQTRAGDDRHELRSLSLRHGPRDGAQEQESLERKSAGRRSRNKSLIIIHDNVQ